MQQPKTRRLRRTSRAKQRHQLQAAALLAGYLVLIAVGAWFWSGNTTHWGLVLAAAGPQPCITSSSPCSAWRIVAANSSTLDSRGITAGMYVCSSNSLPLSSQTSAATIEQAATLAFSTTATCQHLATYTLTEDLTSPLAAYIYWFIALSCGILCALIVQHATQRAAILHVVATLSALVVAFALLVVQVRQQWLQEIDIAFAAYLVPGLLSTLLWRLIFPASTRRFLLARRIAFSVVLGIGGLLALLLIVGVVLANPSLYTLDRHIGEFYLFMYAIALLVVLIGNLRPTVGPQKDYARILGLGTAVSLAPLLIFDILPLIIPGAQTDISGTVAAITFIALPLSLAFVVLKRDLLGVDSLVRITTQRLFNLLLLLLSIAILITATTALTHIPANVAAFFFIPMLAIVALLPVIQGSTRWLTEDWLFPQIRRYREIIARSSAPSQVASPQEIAQQLIGEVKLALPIREASLYVENHQTGDFEEMSDKLTSPASMLHRSHPLIRRFKLPKTTLLLHDDMRSVLARETTAADRHLMEWDILVPIRLRDRLIAILALSPRDDQEAYSATDQTLLMVLAGQRALALDYARVLSDLRDALAQQRELDQLKDQFIMTAHHELRTPLTSLLGYVELLNEMSAGERIDNPNDVEVFLTSAVKSGDDMLALLESLLVADRDALKTTQVKPEWVHLSELIATIVTGVQKGENATRRVSISCPDSVQVWADPLPLGQIVRNLVTNAMKYSPLDSPIIIYVEQHQGEDNLIDVVVRDFGKGIPVKDQATIFEKFVRLERDLNSPIRGSGLGLFVARTQVQAMDGNIWVTSSGTPGAGSSFHFSLPTIPPTGDASLLLTPTTKLSPLERQRRTFGTK